MTSSEAVPVSPSNTPLVKSEFPSGMKSKKRERDNNTSSDEDVEHESSVNMAKETNKATALVTPKKEKKDDYVFSPELLSMYYSRLFPFELLYSWLSYDPSSTPLIQSPSKSRNAIPSKAAPSVFTKREFSFTIEKIPGEEIYIRYKSFPSKKELESTICKMKPHKIDIGAVYTHPPKDKDAFQDFKPTQRELVFDIDLTDYDGVRNCGCKNAQICPKCWTMMTMAMKVLQRGLTEDFGFQHIAWFYSGRRGVHAWVCDSHARNLSNDARSAVASYFEVMADTEHNKDAMNLTSPLHPLLARSYDILEPMFVKHILPESGHGILASSDEWEKLLSTLPESAQKVSDKLLSSWSSSQNISTPEEKWHQIQKNH